MLRCSWRFLCILNVSTASAHPPGAGALCAPLLLHTPVLVQLTSSSFHPDSVVPPVLELYLSTRVSLTAICSEPQLVDLLETLTWPCHLMGQLLCPAKGGET